MKVVLINPRSKNPDEIQQKCFPPVDLMYLASALLGQSYEVEIIDANALRLRHSDVADMVKRSAPELVGVSLLSEILLPTYRLIKSIKSVYPASEIVIGGPHASALPTRVLEEFQEADYVIQGEGEDSIVALCMALENRMGLSQVKGLFYRRDNKVVSNKPVTPIGNLDALPRPARNLLRNVYVAKRYHIILVKQRPVDSIVTSRGCPFRCRFCCNIAQAYRARSPHNVMEEIVSRYEEGIRNFDIADSNFTFDKERALAIFNLIKKERLKISFRIKSRSDSIDEELVKKAKEAGAYLISLGMESGSQKILDRMSKGTTVETGVRACDIVMKAGLKLNTGWIVGFPGETPETLEQTVTLITKIKPTTANLNILVPYPGTDVYKEAKENGTLVGEWSVENSFIPWVKLPWIKSYSHLETVARKARSRVYYRPHYMMSFTKEILCNFNGALACYAFQEARKTLSRLPRRI